MPCTIPSVQGEHPTIAKHLILTADTKEILKTLATEVKCLLTLEKS